MPAITVSISREAHAKLVELATVERRRLYAQAGWMLERLLTEPAGRPPTNGKAPRRPAASEADR